MNDLRHKPWVAGKHILRYFCGTVAYGLRYSSNGGVLLLGYTDFDWGGNVVDQNITSRYCFSLGSMMISWSSRNKVLVSQRTTEDEYTTASTACREAVWLRKLHGGLFDVNIDPTMIKCDNKSCIKLSKNPLLHDNLKHIEMKYHFIQDMV